MPKPVMVLRPFRQQTYLEFLASSTLDLSNIDIELDAPFSTKIEVRIYLSFYAELMELGVNTM